MKILSATLLAAFSASVVSAQISARASAGPEVGQSIPNFTALDQDGVARTSRSILGPKGALLVFFRSADW